MADSETLEVLEPAVNKGETGLNGSTVVENENIDTVPKQLDSEETEAAEINGSDPNTLQKSAEQDLEGKDVDQYKDAKEEYEEQYRDDEKVDVTSKEGSVKVRKSVPPEKDEIVNEEEINKEYKEDLDENGEPITVTKKETIGEYEEKELGENGEPVTITVEGTVEEYEEEELDENGEPIMSIKKRIVKTSKTDLGDKEILGEVGEEFENASEKEKSVKEEPEIANFVEDIEGESKEKEISIHVVTTSDTDVPKEIIEEEEEGKHEDEYDAKSGLMTDEKEHSGEEEKPEEVVTGDEETQRRETKKEESEKTDVKKGKEEDIETCEDEKESLALLSAEKEKIAIAQQYETLAKLRIEHIALKRRNLYLNEKLVQYFKERKMDHVFAERKEDPLLEQQYFKKLKLFMEMNEQMAEENLKMNKELEAQKTLNEDLLERIRNDWGALFARKKEIACKLIDPKTGRTVPYDKTIEDLLNRQETQLKLISEHRLSQIKLKRHIEAKRIERQMQQAGKAFNLMDYEKLSSLKEYYMDKIIERELEIEDVTNNIAAMDDTLTQLKEQLQKKEAELEQEQERLYKITLELNNKRTILNTLKAARQKTEKNTAKIKQQSGLLAYPNLLKDYESKTQQVQLLMSEIEQLKQDHRAAVVRIRKLRETIKKGGEKREEPTSTIRFSNEKTVFK